jgi:hypothetical protein
MAAMGKFAEVLHLADNDQSAKAIPCANTNQDADWDIAAI